MARVKKGVNAHKRHKKILKQAKGFWTSLRTRAANPADKSSKICFRWKKEQESIEDSGLQN